MEETPRFLILSSYHKERKIVYIKGESAILTNRENLLIPGGLLLGMGIGLAMDEVAAGMFIGLGAGFILTTIFTYFSKRHE